MGLLSSYIVLAAVVVMVSVPAAADASPVPDKTVVLTFDDAVKSHLTVVAPVLKKYGFGATFFVTHLWMADTEHFLNGTSKTR